MYKSYSTNPYLFNWRWTDSLTDPELLLLNLSIGCLWTWWLMVGLFSYYISFTYSSLFLKKCFFGQLQLPIKCKSERSNCTRKRDSLFIARHWHQLREWYGVVRFHKYFTRLVVFIYVHYIHEVYMMMVSLHLLFQIQITSKKNSCKFQVQVHNI